MRLSHPWALRPFARIAAPPNLLQVVRLLPRLSLWPPQPPVILHLLAFLPKELMVHAHRAGTVKGTWTVESGARMSYSM